MTAQDDVIVARLLRVRDSAARVISRLVMDRGVMNLCLTGREIWMVVRLLDSCWQLALKLILSIRPSSVSPIVTCCECQLVTPYIRFRLSKYRVNSASSCCNFSAFCIFRGLGFLTNTVGAVSSLSNQLLISFRLPKSLRSSSWITRARNSLQRDCITICQRLNSPA